MIDRSLYDDHVVFLDRYLFGRQSVKVKQYSSKQRARQLFFAFVEWFNINVWVKIDELIICTTHSFRRKPFDIDRARWLVRAKVNNDDDWSAKLCSYGRVHRLKIAESESQSKWMNLNGSKLKLSSYYFTCWLLPPGKSCLNSCNVLAILRKWMLISSSLYWCDESDFHLSP